MRSGAVGPWGCGDDAVLRQLSPLRLPKIQVAVLVPSSHALRCAGIGNEPLSPYAVSELW